MAGSYCCEQMQFELEKECDQHPDRWDCVDALIGYWPDSAQYGIIVHDGGSAMKTISFCPWCGTPLRPLAPSSS